MKTPAEIHTLFRPHIRDLYHEMRRHGIMQLIVTQVDPPATSVSVSNIVKVDAYDYVAVAPQHGPRTTDSTVDKQNGKNGK